MPERLVGPVFPADNSLVKYANESSQIYEKLREYKTSRLLYYKIE